MASQTPTPRDSNGAWLATPRGAELQTVEDFNQAIAFFEKTYEERQSLHVMIKELQLTLTTESTVAQYEQQANNFQPVIDLNKDIGNQVDTLLYAPYRLGYVALSRDVEVVVRNLPSIPFPQPLIYLQG
jgi:hypothetical protein